MLFKIYRFGDFFINKPLHLQQVNQKYTINVHIKIQEQLVYLAQIYSL